MSELDHLRKERLILLSHLDVLKLIKDRTPGLASTRAARICRIVEAVFELDKRIAEIEMGAEVSSRNCA